MSILSFASENLRASMNQFANGNVQFGLQTPLWNEGGEIQNPFFLNQKHSATVWILKENQHLNLLPEADAVISNMRDISLCIKTADCLPILLLDTQNEWVGAVHAGWRGLAQSIISNTIKNLRQVGVRSSALKAFIGPAIRRCCYEVSQDMTTHFGMQYFSTHGEALRLDLHQFALDELRSSGLSDEVIFNVDICSRCHPSIPSVRREGSTCERMITWIRKV